MSRDPREAADDWYLRREVRAERFILASVFITGVAVGFLFHWAIT